MKPALRAAIIALCLAVCAGGLLLRRGSNRGRECSPALLYAAVNRQLAAARADDVTAARAVASIALLQSADETRFGELLHAQAVELGRAQRTEFGPVARGADRALVQVFFSDRAGRVTPCLFRLVNERGEWRVDEVRFLDRWEADERLGGLEL